MSKVPAPTFSMDSAKLRGSANKGLRGMGPPPTYPCSTTITAKCASYLSQVGRSPCVLFA